MSAPKIQSCSGKVEAKKWNRLGVQSFQLLGKWCPLGKAIMGEHVCSCICHLLQGWSRAVLLQSAVLPWSARISILKKVEITAKCRTNQGIFMLNWYPMHSKTMHKYFWINLFSQCYFSCSIGFVKSTPTENEARLLNYVDKPSLSAMCSSVINIQSPVYAYHVLFLMKPWPSAKRTTNERTLLSYTAVP